MTPPPSGKRGARKKTANPVQRTATAHPNGARIWRGIHTNVCAPRPRGRGGFQEQQPGGRETSSSAAAVGRGRRWPLVRAHPEGPPPAPRPCACASSVARRRGTWHGVAGGVRPPHEAAVATVCRVQRWGRGSAAAPAWESLDTAGGGAATQGPEPQNTLITSRDGNGGSRRATSRRPAASHAPITACQPPLRRRSDVPFRGCRQQHLVSAGRGDGGVAGVGPFRARQRRCPTGPAHGQTPSAASPRRHGGSSNDGPRLSPCDEDAPPPLKPQALWHPARCASRRGSKAVLKIRVLAASGLFVEQGQRRWETVPTKIHWPKSRAAAGGRRR